MATITTELWDGGNNDFVVALPDSFDRRWQDRLNDVGSGTVSLAASDTALSQVGFGLHVRFLVDGAYAFTFVIEEIKRERAARDEEYGQVVTLSGRGVGATLDDAVVFPYGGVSYRPASDSRAFTWASPELSTAGWASAVAQTTGTATQQELAAFSNWPPAGWPAPNTSSSVVWIWSRAFAGIHPTGYSYFRSTFTLGAATTIVIFLSADDRARAFLDGVEVIPWTDSYPAWSIGDTHRCVLEVSAGTHHVAIQAENYDFQNDPVYGWSPGSYARVLCAVHSRPAGPAFSSSSLLVGTTASWKCLDYPTDLPAPTPGQILETLRAEAVARGWSNEPDATPDPGLRWGGSFSATTDSAGQPWETAHEFVFKVGDSLLDVLKALAEDRVDFWISPTFQVYVWNKGTVIAPDVATFAVGTNIEELTVSTSGAVR